VIDAYARIALAASSSVGVGHRVSFKPKPLADSSGTRLKYATFYVSIYSSTTETRGANDNKVLAHNEAPGRRRQHPLRGLRPLAPAEEDGTGREAWRCQNRFPQEELIGILPKLA
jgi:hypothetical protein